MNLSINGFSQTASTYQSTNVSAQEQHKEKEIVKESIPDSSSYSAVSKNGDTLTISEAGKSASMNMNQESDSSSDSSTTDLSSYSDSELKQMYLDGTITRSEYTDELNSRTE